jgi:hypothetical protein
MPQLPTSTAEEYGAEDEIKQYNQEEDECSDTSTVDVVNDIKDDLLNEDGRDSGKGGDDSLYQPHSNANRYSKDSGQGLYGSPAAVIVGPHRYYDQPSSYRSGGTNPHGGHGGGGQQYTSSGGTQIRMPMYSERERPYYAEHGGTWPSQVPMPPHYAMHYGPGGIAQKYGYRYPSGIPPGMPYYGPGGHVYGGMTGRPAKEPKRPHVKKPLNAFMLFMKEQRPKIAAEFTLKESAAINQILGKRWHALDKSEQAKYYEMARKERALHMQLYPGWSARDNYAQIGRKKKRPRDKNEEMNPKKCRARYGLDRQEQWCKPCRRKKKCIRFIIGADGETTEVMVKEQDPSDSDDNENRIPNSEDVESKEGIKDLVSSNNDILKLSNTPNTTNTNNTTSDTCTTTTLLPQDSSATSTVTSDAATKDQFVYSPSAHTQPQDGGGGGGVVGGGATNITSSTSGGGGATSVSTSSATSNSTTNNNTTRVTTYTTNGHTLTDLRTVDTKPVDFSRL